jgi:glycosyltransferase involved in cell wall biosynthesis
MKTDADAVVFIDHDLSWEPEDLVRLIQHPGDVVSGDYRFKYDNEEYMGRLVSGDDGRPVVRDDGTLKAHAVPAGFLKVTRAAVERFRKAYPELVYGPDGDYVDLFNHGAHAGLWWGEDYAFSRRWRDMGEEIYLIPDLNITHHLKDQAFPGNLHEFMLRQPGGSKEV